MTDAITPGDLIQEAERRLAALAASPDHAVSDAAREADQILHEPESVAAAPPAGGQMHSMAAVPIFGVALAGASLTENSPWGDFWNWLGLPDPQLIGTIYVKDIAFALLVAALIVLVLRPWRKRKERTKMTKRRKEALEKLARAAKPQYQTSVFKCVGDYELCCRTKTNSKACFALATICITKELIPFATGAKP